METAYMESSKILKSPIRKSLNEIPKTSLAKYILDNLQRILPLCGSRYWVFDVQKNYGIRFNEIEIYSRKIASYLFKNGFKHGDILYTVSYDLSKVYVINLAVWRLGGIVRGCYPGENIETIKEQIIECNAKFIVVDDETFKRVQTIKDDNIIINLGTSNIQGAVNFDDILLDEGKSFPVDITVDPEDSVLICNTSGSTGFPKGTIHTNRSIISEFYKNDFFGDLNNIYMVTNSNYVMGSYIGVILCIVKGMTGLHIGPFDPNTYLYYLETYKPKYITMMPFVAFWLLRYEAQKSDFSYIKHVSILGSVLDLTTIQLLKEKLPNTSFIQAYALTEVIGVTGTEVAGSDEFFQCINQGTKFASCGRAFPFVQIKIIDLDTNESLGPHVRGEILVKGPTLMKGYLNHDSNNVDSDGWFHTGDIGFYDDKENLYIVDRKTFTYKYCLLFISPATIECVLSEHVAVLGVGVIGIPNPETVNLTRAFVVLKPGYETTTENDLITYVAERLPDHSHLHGGVKFIKELPQNRNGKLDRLKLKEIALKML